MAFSFGQLLTAVAKWAVTKATTSGKPRAQAVAKAEKASAKVEARADKAERAAEAREMKAADRARTRERKAAERKEAAEFKRTEAAKDRAARAEGKRASAPKPESKKAAAARAEMASRMAIADRLKASAESRDRKSRAEEAELDKAFKREMAGKGRGGAKAAPAKAPTEKKAAGLKAFAEEGKAAPTGKSRVAGLEPTFNKAAAASERALAHTNAESRAADHHAVGHRLHSQAAQLHFKQAKAAQAAGESKMAESHQNMGRRHRAIAEQHKVQHWGQGEQAAKPRALQRGRKGGTFYVSEGGRKVYVH